MEIQVGIEFSQEKIVTEKDTARVHTSGKLDVFATPAMVGFMENTAFKSVEKYLPEGNDTVGIEINTKHIKATAVGKKVKCNSKLIEVDARKLVFEIEAFDEDGKIGSATHTRFIINVEKFMKNI